MNAAAPLDAVPFTTIGIVGHGAEKFTPGCQVAARHLIRALITPFDSVASGCSPLGGIDSWAIEEARAMGKKPREFPPRGSSWRYFKERNLQIAEVSAVVVCIVVTTLPENFRGRRFMYCYHCKTDSHIKSGGCWTVARAREMGKYGVVMQLSQGGAVTAPLDGPPAAPLREVAQLSFADLFLSDD